MLNDNHFLFSTPIAHRGLWGEGVIENSLTAYKNAVENNYAIEIDVYSSKDGTLFSFHDANLMRMCGVDKNIFDLTEQEILQLNLSSSDQKIPTLLEVLRVVGDKVPLLIEIKNQPRKDIVELLLNQIKNYGNKVAIQSFNPLYILKVKKLAPNICRGILSTNDENHLKGTGAFTKLVVKNKLLNFLIKPHFISQNYSALPLKKKYSKIPVIAWTVTDKTIYEKVKPFSKNIIFEHFIP